MRRFNWPFRFAVVGAIALLYASARILGLTP